MNDNDREKIVVAFEIPECTYRLYALSKELHELESEKDVDDEALMCFIFAIGLEQYSEYVTADIPDKYL